MNIISFDISVSRLLPSVDLINRNYSAVTIFAMVFLSVFCFFVFLDVLHRAYNYINLHLWGIYNLISVHQNDTYCNLPMTLVLCKSGTRAMLYSFWSASIIHSWLPHRKWAPLDLDFVRSVTRNINNSNQQLIKQLHFKHFGI